jgi:hypothetical protein
MLDRERINAAASAMLWERLSTAQVVGSTKSGRLIVEFSENIGPAEMVWREIEAELKGER